MFLSPYKPDPTHRGFKTLTSASFNNDALPDELAGILTEGWPGRVRAEGRHLWITVDTDSGPAEWGLCPTFDYVDGFGRVLVLLGVARHEHVTQMDGWWMNDERHLFTRHLATALGTHVVTSNGLDHYGSECYTTLPLRVLQPVTG
jgi:hypothetical protein